jgi:hypothetical protein
MRPSGRISEPRETQVHLVSVQSENRSDAMISVWFGRPFSIVGFKETVNQPICLALGTWEGLRELVRDQGGFVTIRLHRVQVPDSWPFQVLDVSIRLTKEEFDRVDATVKQGTTSKGLREGFERYLHQVLASNNLATAQTRANASIMASKAYPRLAPGSAE